MGLLPQDPQKQKLVLIGLIPVALAFAYYNFYHKARAVEVAELTDQVEVLEAQNASMRQIVARYGPDLQRRIAVYEEHVRQLEELIPRREDVPMLIRQITQDAENIGVDLAALNPSAEEAGEFYSRQTYELHVLGDYHRIGEYLAAIGTLPRIVKSSEFKINLDNKAPTEPRQSPKLRAMFRIETYIVPDVGTVPQTDPATMSANANG